MLHDTNTS
jgi:hypothetical protein